MWKWETRTVSTQHAFLVTLKTVLAMARDMNLLTQGGAPALGQISNHAWMETEHIRCFMNVAVSVVILPMYIFIDSLLEGRSRSPYRGGPRILLWGGATFRWPKVTHPQNKSTDFVYYFLTVQTHKQNVNFDLKGPRP